MARMGGGRRKEKMREREEGGKERERSGRPVEAIEGLLRLSEIYPLGREIERGEREGEIRRVRG